MSNYSGPSSPPPNVAAGGKPKRPTCGKTGHVKEECWKTFPDKVPLKFRKKIQGVEGRGGATNALKLV